MTLKTLYGALGAMTAAERQMGRYMRSPDPHPDGDFDAAFAAAAAEDLDPPPATEPPAAEPPAAEPPAGEPPAAEPPAGEPPAAEPPAGEPPAAAEPPAVEPPAAEPPAAPSANDIVAQLAEALKANQPAPAAAAPAAPAQEEAPQIYAPEELAVLQEYESNWPDVSKAETLKRRAEYHDLLAFTFKSVRDWMAPHLEQLATLGNMAHEQQVRAQVPDYSPDLETRVSAWIDTEPSYLQAGMKQVMQSGTSEEVADLIRRYQAASGAQSAPTGTAPAAPKAPSAPAAAPKTELSSAAKQAAESLAPVSGERSAVPQGSDPEDFDTAFQKYAAAGATHF